MFSQFNFIRAHKYFRIFFLVALVMILQGCERSTSSDDWNDNLPPAVPIDLFLFKASDGEIVVEWRKNSERDFSHYNIYRAVNDSSSFAFLKKSANNYFFDDSLFYDSTYYYKVTAVDRYNTESAFSAVINAKPINRYKPAAPRFVEINARNWLGKISINLSWEPNFETDVKRYFIYRSELENFTIDSSLLVGISHNIFYQDTISIQIGKKYFYKITAVDNGGIESSAGSEASDLILREAVGQSPKGEIIIDGKLFFKLLPVGNDCAAKIVVQENEFFGEVWSKQFEMGTSLDTISIPADGFYLLRNKDYYWRIITSTKEYFTPNSISKAIHFRVKQ